LKFDSFTALDIYFLFFYPAPRRLSTVFDARSMPFLIASSKLVFEVDVISMFFATDILDSP
jgi:hypothetical protein